jgi:predicted anti-sigma-YlaC factor YlaD
MNRRRRHQRMRWSKAALTILGIAVLGWCVGWGLWLGTLLGLEVVG